MGVIFFPYYMGASSCRNYTCEMVNATQQICTCGPINAAGKQIFENTMLSIVPLIYGLLVIMMIAGLFLAFGRR